MNETIGVKGGHNDYKRVMAITMKQKEKLKKYQEEKELKELEKEVKRKQKYNLIKTLPLVIAGQTIKDLTTQSKKESNEEKFIVSEENIIKEVPKTKKIVIVLKDGTKQIIEVPNNIEINKDEILKENKEEIEEKIPDKEIDNSKKEEPTKEEKQEYIQIKKEKEIVSKEFEDLTENQRNKLKKLQTRKIIDVYEKELKDIRYELRNLIIEYNTLVSEEEKIIKSKEEDIILDKLNEIIKKIEELKNKIRIEDLDKYDDNYIYTLIEGYLEDFKDKKIIKEIKDSPLYILISEKLDEFDKKKEKFKDQVEDKKEKLVENEDKLSELKEKYYSIDKINNDLNDFYHKQEILLREMQDKVDKSVTVSEKIETKIEYMNKQTSDLLSRLALIMLIPGKRGAKAFAAMALIYAYIARGMMQQETTTKKYKEIKVEDYSDDINNSIKAIDQATNDLSKSGKEIDRIILNIKEEFKEYIGVNKDCDELLDKLNKVKNNLKEKEYELEKIKSKQEKELERNNSKVLERGTYPL